MERATLSAQTTIYELAQQYPEIPDIMAELGFKDIVKPMMLQTAGRYMTLDKGARLKGIAWSVIVATFAQHGFDIVD
jgi:hypothetical protein